MLNQWYQTHPDAKGELPDVEKHNEWIKNNEKLFEDLRNEANKSLIEFLKPAGDQTALPTDSKGRLPSHPDYEGGRLAGRLDFGFFDKETWKNLSVVGKVIARGAKNFGQWSKEMISRFGDWIKPALRSLFKLVHQLPNIMKPVSQKELQYKTSEDNKLNPEENKQTVEKDQLMGRLPSVTKGYNMGREHPLLSNTLDKILESMREEFDIRRRGTISNEDLIEVAKRKAEHLTEDDIWNVQQGDVLNAEDLLARRIFVADQVLKSVDEIKKLDTQSDPIEIKQMTNQLVKSMRMYEVVRAVGTELGRGVQSMNIPITDHLLSGMQNAMDVINGLDPDNKYGGKQVKDMIDDIAGEKTDSKEKRATKLDMIRYLFFNWILQNPLTDIANTFGNFSNLSFHLTANLGNLGGLKTLAKGVKNGFKEGTQHALRVIHGEEDAISKFSENIPIDVPATQKRSWKNYFRLLVPTTRLGLEDMFFRALGRNIELNRMSYKVGKQMGIAPDEVANAVASIINDPKIAKYTRQEYQDVATYVQQIEDELVFQNELGTIGKGFQKISKVAFPIMPFVKTPANILKFGVSASPAGFFKLFKKGLSTEERNQVVRRALAGSVAMSGIAGLIAQGLVEITGGGSDDPYDRDLMEKMGYKPYHLYIHTPMGVYGGSYQNINPLNTPLAVMGDLFDKYRFNKMGNKPEDELPWYDKVAQDLSTALLSVGASVTDQSYLSGLRDLMDALSGRNPDWFMRTLTGYARMGGVQGIQRITGTEDRGRYDTKGRMEEQIQKNSPFFSNEGLIKSVSAFGDQRQSQYERFPLPMSEIPQGTAYKWMEENGLKLKIPSKSTKIGNRELGRKEYEMFATGVGKVMDKIVNKLYENQTDPETPEDQKMTLEEMQDQLDKAYDTARKKVMEKIKQKIYEQYKLQEGK